MERTVWRWTWSGNQLVLFYTTFANSYDGYVRLGVIEDVDGFAEALGSGDVTVTIEPAQPTEDNILVAYFSCTGNTEQIAKWIAEESGATLYQITPETPYTSADLNYRDSSTRATVEQNNPSARPVISYAAPNMEISTLCISAILFGGVRLLELSPHSWRVMISAAKPLCRSAHPTSAGLDY